MFLDRGRSAVLITMVPTPVDLQSATRESVMDKSPWVYRRMADELQEEGKAAVYGDVREYLYVDAKLTLSDSAVAAVAHGADGIWRASDRGMKDLAVDRNGWVRIAIPQSRAATDVGFVCYPDQAETAADAVLRSAACWRSTRPTNQVPTGALAHSICRPAKCAQSRLSNRLFLSHERICEVPRRRRTFP